MTGDEIERGDAEALLETRRELGAQFEAELVDGFADRVERAIEKRVDAELERRRSAERSLVAAGPRQLALGIVSLIAFIPLVLALGLNDQFGALLVAVGAIVAVNVAHAWQSHRP